MRLLRRVLVSLASLLVLLAAAAYLLPREADVVRSVVIDAPPGEVFPHVNSMRATEAWSPWMERDPEVELFYAGPESGVGNRMTWKSDDRMVGSGTQEIVASVPGERVETELDFGPMGVGRATFTLEPAGGGTRVTWAFHTELRPNPRDLWFGLFLDSLIGPDYERGLANLRSLVEGG